VGSDNGAGTGAGPLKERKTLPPARALLNQVDLRISGNATLRVSRRTFRPGFAVNHPSAAAMRASSSQGGVRDRAADREVNLMGRPQKLIDCACVANGASSASLRESLTGGAILAGGGASGESGVRAEDCWPEADQPLRHHKARVRAVLARAGLTNRTATMRPTVLALRGNVVYGPRQARSEAKRGP